MAIITGRSSDIVHRRAAELGITDIIQGREDKLTALTELCERNNLAPSDCAYMGDDLPDLAAISAAGLGMTVANGAAAVTHPASELQCGRTSDGNRVWPPRCLAISWSTEMEFLDRPELPAGLAVKMLASARCPPPTPGWDEPEMTVKSFRKSSIALRYRLG